MPLVTAILSECFGGEAWTASLSDIVIQVKGTARSGTTMASLFTVRWALMNKQG